MSAVLAADALARGSADEPSAAVRRVTKAYGRLILAGFALVPAYLIAYLFLFQDPSLKFENHVFHEIAIAIATLEAVFVTYVTWRCYRASGETLLRWMTLGFLGFTLIYSLHGAFTGFAHDNIWLFLLYGPASRLVMAMLLLVALLSYRRPADPVDRRTKPRPWITWIALFLLVDLTVAFVANSPVAGHLAVRLSMEGGALVLSTLNVAILLLRRIRSPLMVSFAISVTAFALSSLAFILGLPWNHMWWLAHVIFAAGFLLLSYGVVQAFHTTRSFATVYNEEELMARLAEAMARTRSGEASARASEKRALRLSRFYEATSRTNQAIVRLKEAHVLYATICNVCVETGQACMAWIGLVQAEELTPVAWGGATSRHTQPFDLDLAVLSQPGRGPFGSSVLDGATRVVDDYMNDPRTARFTERASGLGVRASAIVPFSRAGAVVGTLNLYADETGFFDEGLMRLLVEMAADVSFALDNFDKATIHAQTELELVKRESQLAGIVETAIDPIITFDAQRQILVFNRAAASVFKVPAAQAIGGKLDRFIPERFRSAYARDASLYGHRVPRPLEMGMPRQLLGLRGDGSEFPMEATVSRMDEGDDVLWTVVLRDVTGERDAEAARVAATVSEASNRAKSDFLSRMSHELRTPLNAVLGFSQLLQEVAKEKLNERECRQLDLIFLAGAQLRALVDDVFDVSAIESGRLSLTLRDTELTALLDGVVRMSEAAAREGEIRLVSGFSSMEPLMLRTDPVRLRQVMLNLVSNAIKYNKPGGTVTVGIQALHGSVRITVADTGMGMSREQLSGLFQPFNRLGRETSQISGSGIGMALVRQLVELLGGSISVRSEPSAGTVVAVDIMRPKIAAPLLDGPDPSTLVAGTAAAAGASPSGLVLYIEDNPVNVILVRHILGRWPDVHLVVAEDGASGIRQAMELSPDVLLLDMQLPDMFGLDVLKALRANAATRSLRVVSLSASTLQEDLRAARAAGAQDYWTKPIDVESFCEGMKRLLQAKEGVAPVAGTGKF